MPLPTVNIDIKSETVTKAIELIARAGYVLYEPSRIKKKAKAESEAREINAKSDIKISFLQKQALNRILSTETLRQKNINNLTSKALCEVVSSQKQIDTTTDVDWIKKYFSFSQDISNDDMQNLWSKILSGELIRAGSFSYKTMSILANMRKEEAELFSKIYTFVVSFGPRLVPLIYEDGLGKNEYNNLFSFEDMQFLYSLGLIHFNDVGEYTLTSASKDVIVNAGEKTFLISSETEGKNVFKVGKVLLTKEGQELSGIINPIKSKDLLDIIKSNLITAGRSIKEIP